MRFSRVLFALCILAIPVFAQPPGGMGNIMAQFGGKGGREGMMTFMNNANPDDLFNQFSKGKDVIRRDDLDPFAQMMFDRAARQMNITNGQISRDQFKDAFGQMRNRIQAGGGANAFGGQPNPEMQDRFAEQRFRSYDKNSDGLLSSEEMPEALRNERDKWDSNKDGFVDLGEFKGYFKSRFEQRGDRGDGQAGSSEQPNNVNQLPAQDQVFDITRPVVYRAGFLPKELPDWFKQLDVDVDGQVGLYEWVKGGKSVTEFREIDINDDGLIIAEEVIRVVLGKKPANTSGSIMGSSITTAIGTMMMNNAMSQSFNGRNNNGNNNGNNGGGSRFGGGDGGNMGRWWGGMGGERGKGKEGGRRGFNGNGERSKGGERSKDGR